MTKNFGFEFNLQRFTAPVISNAGSSFAITGGSFGTISGGNYQVWSSSYGQTYTPVGTMTLAGGGSMTNNFILAGVGGVSMNITMSDSVSLGIGTISSGAKTTYLNGSLSFAVVGSSAFSENFGVSGGGFSLADANGAQFYIKGNGTSLTAVSLTSGKATFSNVLQDMTVASGASFGMGAVSGITALGEKLTLAKGTGLNISLAGGSLGLELGAGAQFTVNSIGLGFADAVASGGYDNKVITGATGTITVNNATAGISSGAVTLAGDGANAYIAGIEAASGTWVVGTTNQVTLGSQTWQFGAESASITADAAGTTAKKVEYLTGATVGGGVTGTLQANTLTWSFGGTSFTGAQFDANGGITSLTGDGTLGWEANTTTGSYGAQGGGNYIQFASSKAASIDIVSGNIAKINGTIASDAAIETKAQSIAFSSTTLTASSTEGMSLSADTNGTAFDGVTVNAGTVTLEGFDAATAQTFDVSGNAWSWQSVGSAVVFDEEGNISVAGGAGASIGGAEGKFASVASVATETSVNGAAAVITGDKDGAAYGLEEEGIASITGVDSGAVVSVSGDTAFAVNDSGLAVAVTNDDEVATFTYTKAAKNSESDKATFTLTSANEGAYEVTGGDGLFVFTTVAAAAANTGAATASDLVSSADEVQKVEVQDTVNGVQVVVESAGDVSLSSADGDAITGVTLSADTTLKTSGDGTFAVSIDGADSDDDNQLVINNFTVGGANEGMAIDLKNSDKANVEATITGATEGITLSAGDYVVNGTEVSLNETSAVSIEGGEVKDVQASSALEAEKAISTAIGNLYTEATENDEDSIALSASIAAGEGTVGNMVVSGEDGSYSITADSTGNTPIVNIDKLPADATLATVGLSDNSGKHQVLIGVGDDEVSIPVEVKGGAGKDTVVIGAQATGSNTIDGGDGKNYLVDQSGGKNVITGGKDKDTIIGADKDTVTGGDGADAFRDSGSFTITDYDASQGDVIVASKLGTAEGSFDIKNVKVEGNTIKYGTGGTITLGEDDEASQVAAIANAEGKDAQAVAWGGEEGGALDVSGLDKAAYILGDVNGAADTITGTAKNDTVTAGAGDVVDAGAGKNQISLTAATGETGAAVKLTEGKDTITGWKDWDEDTENADGANALLVEGEYSVTSDKDGNVVVKTDSGEVTFADSDGKNFNFLIGTSTGDLQKAAFVSDGTISDLSEMADVYFGDSNSSLTFTDDISGNIEEPIDLSQEGKFAGIGYVEVANAGTASVVGSDGKDTVKVSGAAEDNASKTVDAGAGNDLIISDNSTGAAANTFVFGKGDGKDTIEGFKFFAGSDSEEKADLISFDDISGEEWNNKWNDSGVMNKSDADYIRVNANDTDVISIARTTSGNVDDIISIELDGTTYTGKVGDYTADNNFTYDADAKYYHGNTNNNNDTITASGESVNIWLTQSPQAGTGDPNGNTYRGIGYLDASAVTGSAVLVGADGMDNTLKGADSGASTLWGGCGGNNLLIGGEGEDTFVLYQFNGNNDTISGIGSGDVVDFANAQLSDIVVDTIDDEGVHLQTADGTKLLIAGSNFDGVTFKNAESTWKVEDKQWVRQA